MANANGNSIHAETRRFTSRPPKPEWLFLATVLLTILFGVICSIISRRAAETGVVIHFVVPSGFRGLVNVECESPDAAAEQWTGNRVTYSIPANGNLRVRRGWAFSQWHKLEAERDAGRVLATCTDDSVGGTDNEERLWELGATAGDENLGVHTVQMFVGTRSEFKDIQSKRAGFTRSDAPARGDNE